VVQGVHVAGTLPDSVVVLTTGGRTEQFVMAELPHLPEAAFVQMGDFLRYAMAAAVKAGLKRIVIGGMVGKLTKIAQGETITHAGRADVNTGLLADLAAGLGAPAEVCEDIRQAKTARYAGERMDALGLGAAFHTALAQRVIQTLRARYPESFELKVLVCDFEGHKIAEAST
jgi:cobalt-precorrin-5B (C1)-methyltransferase